MNKYPLIGGSICAVVLLVLASLTNVVGFQTVQSSNQKIINDEINQKELLFQTIVDIANNKEIQKVILGSEITGKRFFGPGMKFSTFTSPVLTEKSLKHAYTMGVLLTKIMSKSKMHLMIKQFQVNNQGVQKEINAVIEKDAKLKGKMTQLSNSKCDCGNDNTTTWTFPIICTLLIPLWWFSLFLYFVFGITFLGEIMGAIGSALHCVWW
jgi:hypothetical protein